MNEIIRADPNLRRLVSFQEEVFRTQTHTDTHTEGRY